MITYMKQPKSITIVSAVYPPEPQISARISFDLANFFSNKSFNVTVICPQPSRPLNANFDEYIKPGVQNIVFEGAVKVVRLSSFASPQSKLLSRIRESYSFGSHVSRFLRNEKSLPDAMYVNSWPVLSQAIITMYAKKHSIPMVLQIMDIYPEALTGKLPTFIRFLINFPLKKLDAWIAGSAENIVVISENMRSIYTKDRHLSAKFISTIPTWQDELFFENNPSRSECCLKYGVCQNLFTFLYLGNIGHVAGVDFLIKAFASAGIPNAQLLIVGDGAARSDCVALVSRLNLSRVHFISDADARNVPTLQGLAHICLLPMKRGSAMSSVPSKLPSYLFSAKPVIATVDLGSDTAHFVRQAECGWVGEPEDLIWMAAKMKEVSKLPLDQLELIGQRGKKFGLFNFSKSSGVERLASKILQAAGENV